MPTGGPGGTGSCSFDGGVRLLRSRACGGDLNFQQSLVILALPQCVAA